jgi:predicted phosphohydrolase
MQFVSRHFKKTFYIAGNHEYYHKTKTISEINDFLVDYFQQFENISFLNNQFEIYDNYCFIGSTLWSSIQPSNYVTNDLSHIFNFDYIQYNQLNLLSVDFLHNALQHNNNCIIITHHLPSSSLIDVKYQTAQSQPFHQWFFCNLDHLIDMYADKIKCWIYGHTHTASNVRIHNIPFLCNPIGYPNENPVSDFDQRFILH